MSNYSFKYNILDVVSYLHLTIRQDKNSTLQVDCPFCTVNPVNGHTGKGKMQIKVATDQFRCPRCCESGGMLELLSKVQNVSCKVADKLMLDYVGADNYDRSVTIEKQKKAVVSEGKQASKASDEIIDLTYREFLGMCSLTAEHRKHLKEIRGLNSDDIKQMGFKSVPTQQKQHTRITNRLQLFNHQMEGVPGFFVDKKGNWNFNTFSYAKGIFIPMKNINNQIQGMQIRLDNPKEDNCKYIWFSSSNKAYGTSSGSPYHITRTENLGKTVYITEGGLKGNIASKYSGKPFVAVAGVNNISCLPPLLQELKSRGVERIIDCFDTDCEYNKSVEEARAKLKDMVLNYQLDYVRMTWDTTYKGIDDYLLAIPYNQRKFHCVETKCI